MTCESQIENVNEVIVVQDNSTQAVIETTEDTTTVIVSEDSTIIETNESITSIVHEMDVLQIGGGSGNSFFPSGW